MKLLLNFAESLLLGSLLWLLGVIGLVILPEELLSILEAAQMGEGQSLGRLAPKEAGNKADRAVELHQSYMMSKRCRGARRNMRCIVQVVGKNYRFLHDAISDFFVEFLKADLKSLSAGKLGEISLASKWCPTVDSSYDKATLKTGKAKIAAGALLPHEIIGALNEMVGKWLSFTGKGWWMIW